MALQLLIKLLIGSTLFLKQQTNGICTLIAIAWGRNLSLNLKCFELETRKSKGRNDKADSEREIAAIKLSFRAACNREFPLIRLIATDTALR